jgi:hypothetical protein
MDAAGAMRHSCGSHCPSGLCASCTRAQPAVERENRGTQGGHTNKESTRD